MGTFVEQRRTGSGDRAVWGDNPTLSPGGKRSIVFVQGDVKAFYIFTNPYEYKVIL